MQVEEVLGVARGERGEARRPAGRRVGIAGARRRIVERGNPFNHRAGIGLRSHP